MIFTPNLKIIQEYILMDQKMRKRLLQTSIVKNTQQKFASQMVRQSFPAKIGAIDLAFQYIASKRIWNSIIFSDSLSVLQSLHKRKLESPLLANILVKHTKLSTSHNIVYSWLPSHVGIKGNDNADSAAKMALSLESSDFKTPYTDFKRCIKDCFVRNGRHHGMMPWIINFILSSQS